MMKDDAIQETIDSIGEKVLYAYNCGLEEARAVNKDAAMEGMNKAWAAAKELMDMPYHERQKATGVIVAEDIFYRLSGVEAVEMLEKYHEAKEEEKKELHVGDQVRDCSGNLCVITNMDSHIHVLYKNGKTHKWPKKAKFTKTGRRFPVMPLVEIDK